MSENHQIWRVHTLSMAPVILSKEILIIPKITSQNAISDKNFGVRNAKHLIKCFAFLTQKYSPKAD